MHLRSLRLAGFKTFASPVTLDFGAGLTAIVGPNGSGKSNIVDALRWSLGEQSMRELRGRRSEDVIFAGSIGRRPSAMAEVSLTLEIGEDVGPNEPAEVELTRRVYRSGEGEYVIGRRKVRLRDFQDLVTRTGLGGVGNVIVGQGLVDAVLSARGSERHALIATAAGVGPYVARRAEAQARLTQVRTDVARAEAVLREIEPRSKLLRRAAATLRTAQAARHALETGLRHHYAARRQELQARVDAQEASMGAHELRIQRLRASIQVAESEQEALRTEHATLLRAQEDARAKVNAAWKALTSAQLSAEQARESLASLDIEITELRHRRVELDSALLEARVSLHKADSTLKTFVATEAEARVTLPVEEQKMKVRLAELAEAESALGAARLHTHTVLDAFNGSCRYQRRIQEELARAEQVYRECQVEVERLHTESSSAERESEEATARLAEAEKALAAQHAALEAAAASFGDIQAALQAHRAQLEALVRRRSLLEEDLTVCRDQRVRSEAGQPTVAELLQVDLEWAPAVAGVLRELALHPATAEDGVPGLRQAAVPPSGWRARVTTALDATGLCWRGWLDDYAEGDGGAGAVHAHLCTALVLDECADLDTAWHAVASLSNPGPECVPLRLVAMTGDIRGAGYQLAPSSASGEAVAREVRIRTLERQRGDVVRDIEAREREQLDMEEEKRRRETAVGEARRCYEGARGDERAAAETAARVDRSLSGLRADLQRMLARGAALDADIARLRAKLVETEGSVRAHEHRVRAAQETEATATKEVESKRTCAQAARDAHQAARERVELCCRRREVEVEALERARRALGRVEDEAERVERRLHVAEEMRSQKLALLQAAETKIAQGEAMLAGAREEALGALDVDPDALGRQMADIDSRVRSLRIDLEGAVSGRARAAGDLDRARLDLEMLAQECVSDIGCDVSTLPLPERSEAPSALDIRRLRQKAESAAEVDPGVEAEYIALEERRARLEDQIADLTEAAYTLEEVIRECDREARRRWRRAFDRIGELFAQHFLSMFGGGTAALVDAGDDESPAVDIAVQLPGKRTRELTALSGGERTLVAGAFLFALIASTPPPFCVLDEVDAALDETNVDRFLDVLRRLSRRTQFVLVTHNRATMAAADVLYGVTMGADGASRVLSVRLHDIAV